MLVTTNYFAVLGARTEQGRAFTATDGSGPLMACWLPGLDGHWPRPHDSNAIHGGRPLKTMRRLGQVKGTLTSSMHVLNCTTHLLAPPGDVFGFFAEVQNLDAITPRDLAFEIVTAPPIHMAAGTLIDLRLRLFGVPFRWRTRIVRWEPSSVFVDEQLKGPYRRWVHTHTFRETPGGGTEALDHVEYALPLWPFGEIAYPMVRFQLARIFAYRKRCLEQRFGTASGT